MIAVSVVVLAYGDEPWLEGCVDAVLESRDVEVEVILVDNGCTDGGVERIDGRPGVTILRPGRNLGFAGGCNLGAEHATGEIIALVNSDAMVQPSALFHLATVARDPRVGIASASVRLADQPELLNSGGNEIHFLGFGWSGAFGEAASMHVDRRPVASASGAGMAIARELWRELGGFDDHYFAYHEDADLSLRCWQQGFTVEYVPEAVVMHHYEFSRNPEKYYLLERNRLIFVLTLWGTRMLILLAPVLLAVEVALFGLAATGGWGRAKLRSWSWIWRHRGWIRRRRRELQAARSVPDRQLSHLFSARLDPQNYPMPRAMRPLDALLGGYWRLVARAV